MNIRFSVLMCVYKNDSVVFFGQALNSIWFNQTRKPDEIVLVVDGPISVDHQKLILEFEKSVACPFKVIRNNINIGQGASLNKGLSHCSYDYVARMDSDDISEPSRFQNQISFLERNKEIDVLSSAVVDFQEEKKLGIRRLPSGHAAIYKYARLRSPVNHGCCVYKKSKVLSVGGYSNANQCQDYILWLEMLSTGHKFANLESVDMKVRFTNGYARKSGLLYCKEEFLLYPYIKKITNSPSAAIIVLLRAIVRCLPERTIGMPYYILRKYF